MTATVAHRDTQDLLDSVNAFARKHLAPGALERAHDPRYAGVQDIGDVPEFDRMEITHFFEVYKDLEPGKSVEGSHWEGRDQAYEEIAAYRARAAKAAGGE